MPDCPLSVLSSFNSDWPRADPPGYTAPERILCPGTWGPLSSPALGKPLVPGALGNAQALPGTRAPASFLAVRAPLRRRRWQLALLLSLSLLQGPSAALSGTMQALVSPVTKAIFVALFLFAILLILYVILWYICRDVDNDYI